MKKILFSLTTIMVLLNSCATEQQLSQERNKTEELQQRVEKLKNDSISTHAQLDNCNTRVYGYDNLPKLCFSNTMEREIFLELLKNNSSSATEENLIPYGNITIPSRGTNCILNMKEGNYNFRFFYRNDKGEQVSGKKTGQIKFEGIVNDTIIIK